MIILCGKTCSGKNYIRDLLIDKGFEPVVTYTTRPMRESEINGKTYHFLSEEEFKEKIDKGFFLEYTSYNVASGETWYYGSHFDEKDNNKVIILNPHGVDALMAAKHLEVNPLIIYLDVPENILRDRLKQRRDNKSEADRRLELDAIDFKDIYKKADLILDNSGNIPAETLVDQIVEAHDYNLFLNKKIFSWSPSKPAPKIKAKNFCKKEDLDLIRL